MYICLLFITPWLVPEPCLSNCWCSVGLCTHAHWWDGLWCAVTHLPTNEPKPQQSTNWVYDSMDILYCILCDGTLRLKYIQIFTSYSSGEFMPISLLCVIKGKWYHFHILQLTYAPDGNPVSMRASSHYEVCDDKDHHNSAIWELRELTLITCVCFSHEFFQVILPYQSSICPWNDLQHHKT